MTVVTSDIKLFMLSALSFLVSWLPWFGHWSSSNAVLRVQARWCSLG